MAIASLMLLYGFVDHCNSFQGSHLDIPVNSSAKPSLDIVDTILSMFTDLGPKDLYSLEKICFFIPKLFHEDPK